MPGLSLTSSLRLSRRRFLMLGLGGLAGGVVAACSGDGPAAEQGAAGAPAASTSTGSTAPSPATSTATGRGSAASPTVEPAASPTPLGAAPPGTLLSNENVPGFYVRYYQPFPAPDPAAWQLVVEGLVDAPARLTLEQVLKELDHKEQNTRMKCVECWSSRAVWGGFTYGALAALVRPRPDATHLRFDCADGYWEVLPVSELQREGALFVTHMNGILVPAKYGAPLRMIIPWLYAYKGAKAITRLTFQDRGGPGYWSTVGPYTVDGAIQAGRDYPLDIGEPREIQGGEITAY